MLVLKSPALSASVDLIPLNVAGFLPCQSDVGSERGDSWDTGVRA